MFSSAPDSLWAQIPKSWEILVPGNTWKGKTEKDIKQNKQCNIWTIINVPRNFIPGHYESVLLYQEFSMIRYNKSPIKCLLLTNLFSYQFLFWYLPTNPLPQSNLNSIILYFQLPLLFSFVFSSRLKWSFLLESLVIARFAMWWSCSPMASRTNRWLRLST